KAKILDAGCGLGLFLHDLAEIIEGRFGPTAADFYGIDVDQVAIVAATDFAKISKPPHPYLNFYLHDVTLPLEKCRGLFLDKQYKFDFIRAHGLIEYLPNARQHVERLYQALKPGGVIYLGDVLFKRGPDGWIAPHPAFEPFADAFFSSLLGLNQGV